MDKKKIKSYFFSIRLVIEDTMVKLTIVMSANAGKKNDISDTNTHEIIIKWPYLSVCHIIMYYYLIYSFCI